MIELKKVTKSFKYNPLFDEVDMVFEPGKKTIVVGDNGSGKSVLLKLIVGYSLPDSGKIFVEGVLLGENFDFLPDAGVSIDAPQFANSLSGMENLKEIAAIKKIASTEKILSLAKRLQLEKDLKKRYATYSLGMRQKMRLIQALMEEPTYLILDEPFDALDQDMKEVAKEMIDEYLSRDKKRTVIFTSHDEQSRAFADCVVEILSRKLEKTRG